MQGRNEEELVVPQLMKCKAASESPPPSSSMDSCGVGEPPAAVSTASSRYRPPISTDLHLGLSRQSCSSSIQTAHSNRSPSTPRSALTTTTAATADTPGHKRGGDAHEQETLFVKVYMEGVPIGRKLDLLLLDGYDGLLALLARMFKAYIIHPDIVGGDHQGETQDRHVLTYQDQEGDWLMAGDVPWEVFLVSVKKLRIARAESCFH